MLTDRECRTAQGGDKPFKLADAHGLHLLVSPTGHKSWRLKYRFAGKEKQVGFGAYPEVKLSQAREMRDRARALLREGRDPGMEFGKHAGRTPASESDRSFETVARAWWKTHLPQWKQRHADDVMSSLETNLFPKLGAIDIAALKPSDFRPILQAIQARGAIETAHRVLQRASAIFVYAIANELVENNPNSAIRPGLQKVVKRKQPAVTTIDRAREFLKAFEAIPAHPPTKLASRLLALTAARPGMIQMAQSGEFEGLDGSSPVWRVPAAKMKLSKVRAEELGNEFILPLSHQAAEVVKLALAYSSGRLYLFPSARHARRPITDNALNMAYRRVTGWEGQQVPHGWRATFSTVMNERALDEERAGDRAIIDLMLAHQQDGVESRYNRAAYMPRRREIAQDWADLLCVGLIPAEELLTLPRR